MRKILYCRDAKGQIREWKIEAFFDDIGGDWAHLRYTYGLVDGEKIDKEEEVFENQSGRDIYEQLNLQFESKISKMKDRGYVEDIMKAETARTNLLGLPRPMLAQKFNKVRRIDYSNAFIQRKYDGNRCLVANVGGEIIAYSRNGKRVSTIEHITSGIQIPESAILDGELYCHGESLQTIVSWIKRKQANTSKLRLHVYDTIRDESFAERDRFMKHECSLGQNAEFVPVWKCHSAPDAINYTRVFRNEGYEGAILRWGPFGYEDSKRSKGLVKLKEWNDKEFLVTDITASKDGWAILHMLAPTEDARVPFRATAPGTIEEKIDCYLNRKSYIGRYVTIEYAYLTKDGVPFHPIAKCWRSQ